MTDWKGVADVAHGYSAGSPTVRVVEGFYRVIDGKLEVASFKHDPVTGSNVGPRVDLIEIGPDEDPKALAQAILAARGAIIPQAPTNPDPYAGGPIRYPDDHISRTLDGPGWACPGSPKRTDADGYERWNAEKARERQEWHEQVQEIACQRAKSDEEYAAAVEAEWRIEHGHKLPDEVRERQRQDFLAAEAAERAFAERQRQERKQRGEVAAEVEGQAYDRYRAARREFLRADREFKFRADLRDAKLAKKAAEEQAREETFLAEFNPKHKAE